jgi:16S rRNA G966 N2-methylase RsmD
VEFCGGTDATVNTLFYGDNLDVLRSEIASETVDLIYLDPPFNSQATYNVLFKSTSSRRRRSKRSGTHGIGERKQSTPLMR